MKAKKSKWLRLKAVCSLQKLVTYPLIQHRKHCFFIYKSQKVSDTVHISLDKFRGHEVTGKKLYKFNR